MVDLQAKILEQDEITRDTLSNGVVSQRTVFQQISDVTLHASELYDFLLFASMQDTMTDVNISVVSAHNQLGSKAITRLYDDILTAPRIELLAEKLRNGVKLDHDEEVVFASLGTNKLVRLMSENVVNGDSISEAVDAAASVADEYHVTWITKLQGLSDQGVIEELFKTFISPAPDVIADLEILDINDYSVAPIAWSSFVYAKATSTLGAVMQFSWFILRSLWKGIKKFLKGIGNWVEDIFDSPKAPLIQVRTKKDTGRYIFTSPFSHERYSPAVYTSIISGFNTVYSDGTPGVVPIFNVGYTMSRMWEILDLARTNDDGLWFTYPGVVVHFKVGSDGVLDVRRYFSLDRFSGISGGDGVGNVLEFVGTLLSSNATASSDGYFNLRKNILSQLDNAVKTYGPIDKAAAATILSAFMDGVAFENMFSMVGLACFGNPLASRAIADKDYVLRMASNAVGFNNLIGSRGIIYDDGSASWVSSSIRYIADNNVMEDWVKNPSRPVSLRTLAVMVYGASLDERILKGNIDLSSSESINWTDVSDGSTVTAGILSHLTGLLVSMALDMNGELEINLPIYGRQTINEDIVPYTEYTEWYMSYESMSLSEVDLTTTVGLNKFYTQQMAVKGLKLAAVPVVALVAKFCPKALFATTRLKRLSIGAFNESDLNPILKLLNNKTI